MLRKLYKLALLPALLVLATGPEAARGQGSQPAIGTNVPATSPEAAIWAATAQYVYQDDPKLKQIQPELLATIKSNSIKSFGLSIDDAVALEKKQLAGQKDLLKFQELFKTVQAQPSASHDPVELAKAIVARLDDNKERMADPARAQQLALLTQHLTQLATGAEPTPPTVATSAETADNPLAQGGAAPVATAAPVAATASLGPVTAPPTSQWLWISLALSALSLASVAVLWKRLANTKGDLERIKSNWENSSSKNISSKGPSVADPRAIEREVSRQLEQRAAAKQGEPAGASTMPPAPAEPSVAPEVTLPPLPPLSPLPPAYAPRLRTQYVGEAPFNNSFPARALSDQPGMYSMFAIESTEETPEQGTFAVTGNLASHVRDHRSVLEPVCEYVGGYPLGSETRVITEQPGVVRRRGDDWEVVQRAKVRFE
jgi:hypothetical protein